MIVGCKYLINQCSNIKNNLLFGIGNNISKIKGDQVAALFAFLTIAVIQLKFYG